MGVIGIIDDVSDLSCTRWGVRFAADADPSVRDGLNQLLPYRRARETKEFAAGT
jgi:hypothetical protein